MSNPFLVDAHFSTQPISVLATYDSFSTSTGALLTDGGLGVKLSAHIGEQLTVNSVNITPSLGDIIYERERVLTSNTFSPATVGDFIFYNDVTQSFVAIVSVHVAHDFNSALDKNAIYQLHGALKPTGWILTSSFNGDITGIKFSITNDMIGPRAAGSLLYVNPNDEQTTTTIRFRAHTVSPSGALNDAVGGGVASSSIVSANAIDYTVDSSADWNGFLPTTVQGGLDTLADSFSNIRFNGEYHVSKSGNDSTGNGSLGKPFLTIGAAIAATNLLSDSTSAIIFIHPGIYTENVTISKPKTSLVGMTNTFSNACQINGNVTIDPRAELDSVYNTIFSLENLLMTCNSGHVLQFTGSYTGYLHVAATKLWSTSSGSLIYINNSSPMQIKVDLYKCHLNATTGTGSCIECNTGKSVTATVKSCDIYGNSSVNSVISRSFSTMNFTNTYFEGPSPFLFDALDTSIFSFVRCGMTSNTTNASGIRMSSTAIGGVYHCFFTIPTNSSYPTNLAPPASTTGYVVKGAVGSTFTYGDVSFVPLSNINGTFYWTTNKISNAITIVPSQTAFSGQA